MPVQLASALGYVLAAIAAGLALYYWRKSAGLYSLLVESANRHEELRQRGATVEQALHKTEEKLKQNREQAARLTEGLDQAREKTAELTSRIEAKEHEIRLKTEKLELQKGHLEKQLTKAQDMLRIAEEQRLAAQAQLVERDGQTSAALRDVREKAQATARELAAKEQGWLQHQAETEREKAALLKKLSAADPVEMRKLKRKLAQYDRLYASMKGLREMSEERNRNWEVALRKLSAFILVDGGRVQTETALPQAIGPLVGQALQAIGAQLIDDESTEGEGASRAESMDAEDLLPVVDNAQSHAAPGSLVAGLSLDENGNV